VRAPQRLRKKVEALSEERVSYGGDEDMTESKVPGVFAFEMDARAEDNPDFPVLTFDNSPHAPDEVLTYADLVTKGRKLACALQKQGIGRGDVFALLMQNHPEVVLSLYAGSALGAIVVPIDPRLKGERLAYQLQNSNSKGVIFTAQLMDVVEEVLPLVPNLRVLGVVYKDDFGVPPKAEYPSINEVFEGPEAPGYLPTFHSADDFYMIIYTSGTTGLPKGVLQRANRMLGYALLGKMVWNYTSEDRLYTGLSLAHGNAHAVTLTPALFLGVPAVISRRFTKSRIWDICRVHNCTTFSLLGGMMMGIYAEPERLEDADNPVKVVISAGTPRAIWEAFEKRFNVRIHEWYGAVEGGFAHKPPGVGPIGSFGKPLEVMEMKVVREDDTECQPGEIGELVWRLKTGVTEVQYYGDQKASEAKTRGGWVRTGDMVHRDEEGWLFFDYRKGGGLRRQGEFILPEHVEAVIARHPDVTDVCVYGVPASSGAPGESDLVAAIVPTEGREPDVLSIFQMCVNELERNSIPSFIQVVDEIPKTISQKNLDRVLREQFDPNSPNVYRFEDYKRKLNIKT